MYLKIFEKPDWPKKQKKRERKCHTVYKIELNIMERFRKRSGCKKERFDRSREKRNECLGTSESREIGIRCDDFLRGRGHITRV